jgi:hypothetical protein
MTSDPLSLIEQLEAAKRKMPRGSHLNPNVIEAVLAELARAVISPEEVTNPRLDYRPRSVRDAILSRLARLYRISMFSLRFDFTVAMDKVQEERAEMIKADEVEILEGMIELTPKEQQ